MEKQKGMEIIDIFLQDYSSDCESYEDNSNDSNDCQCKICKDEYDEEEEENEEERGFSIVKEPVSKKNSDILFFRLLEISYDDKLLTKKILNCKVWYKDYKQSIFKQFTKIDMTNRYKEAYNLIDHPIQIKGDTYGQCLCSKCGIKSYFIIENEYTNKKCWVGSTCIVKFFPHLENVKNELLRRIKNKELGNICLYCNQVLVSMRKKINREFYCNIYCKAKMEYIVPFGKFKNKCLVEVMCTPEGQSYIEWAKQMLQKDPESFYRYPLFQEIISETAFIEDVDEKEEKEEKEEI